MTKSQVDRLGDRLRAGDVSDADLRSLDDYRESFSGAYDLVMHRLRTEFGLSPTGRAAKTTFAVLGKLRRESARLSQIQDIAGCRVIVPDVPAQDALVHVLESAFERASVVDRRQRPSHGYRAVHVVVSVGERSVEVQVRTTAQQLWAEMSEKLSDQFGIDVKYGGGTPEVRDLLNDTSDLVHRVGVLEANFTDIRTRATALNVTEVDRSRIDEVAHTLDSIRDALRDVVSALHPDH